MCICPVEVFPAVPPCILGTPSVDCYPLDLKKELKGRVDLVSAFHTCVCACSRVAFFVFVFVHLLNVLSSKPHTHLGSKVEPSSEYHHHIHWAKVRQRS